jgi:cyanophycinase
MKFSTPMLALLLLASDGRLGAQSVSTHGPSRGSLVLQGGVGDNRAIISAFVARAGGPASHVVVIPTASVGDAGPPGMSVTLARRMRDSFGVAAFTVVHTIDRAEADSDSFVEPIRNATGVWMLGDFRRIWCMPIWARRPSARSRSYWNAAVSSAASRPER